MRAMEFGGSPSEPQVRTFQDLKGLLYDPDKVKLPPETPMYFMYRDLSLSLKDRETLRANHLRYDITVIPPATLGCEYIKTAGHYHPPVPGAPCITYPELYEVLEGSAHYLLQKSVNARITDVILVEAKKGDKVIMPPNYGHVTINPSNRELRMANLVSDSFDSAYAPYKEKRGAAYYELIDGLKKNEGYGMLPEVRRLMAGNIAELGLKKTEEIYALVKRGVQRLNFLNRPQDAPWLSVIY